MYHCVGVAGQFVYAGFGVTDVSGCIDDCRYTLVLVWMMLVVLLMLKLHLSLGVALASNSIDFLVTP